MHVALYAQYRGRIQTLAEDPARTEDREGVSFSCLLLNFGQQSGIIGKSGAAPQRQRPSMLQQPMSGVSHFVSLIEPKRDEKASTFSELSADAWQGITNGPR